MRTRFALLTAGLLALGSHAAFAADLAPVLKAPPRPVPIFSWTGFYVGGHFGGGWGTTESTLHSINFDHKKVEVLDEWSGGGGGGFSIPLSQTQTNGFLGGVQGGYNYQVYPWLVLGIEGDFSWTNIKGTSPCVSILACSTKHDWLADITGRVGLTLDRLMFYGKGGVAWAETTYGASLGIPYYGFSTQVKDTRVGVLVGLGAEYAFLPDWSAKIEYNFIDFGHQDYTFPVSAGHLHFTANTSIKESLHLVKAGVNWRFATGPY